jgi:hypothetical protein
MCSPFSSSVIGSWRSSVQLEMEFLSQELGSFDSARVLLQYRNLVDVDASGTKTKQP